MKHLPRIFPVLISILIALVVTSGCKENTLINSKVSPSNNAIGVFDTTLPCITHSFYDDTVLTSFFAGGIPVYQGVGASTDSFFGTTIASTYFNVIPFDFTALQDALMDSAILVLPYSGFTYGDTVTQTLTQTYQVFYMLDTMSVTSNYYSSSTKPIDVNHPLSAPTTVNTYHLKDSFGSNVLAQNQAGLRIKLNMSVLKSLLINAVNNSTDNSNFLTAFNGICVQVADKRQSGASIPYFQLDGSGTYSQACILLYQHTAGTQSVVATPYYFSKGNCAHFNSITRSYSRFPVNNLYNSTQPNDQVVVIQNRPGANIDVIIPGLKNLPQGIINKADLRLSIVPGYGNYLSTGGVSTLLAPTNLFPSGVGNGTYPAGITNGLTYIVSDRYPLQYLSPYAVLDGSLHTFISGSTTVQTYVMGIPREVMASIAAKNDTIHLHIDGTQDFYGAFRSVLGGGNYPDTMYRAKLFVVYSKLKN